METNSKTLNWRFDVSTFKLLGRELITDRITAIFELVKNCYDANAENVTIEFYDVGKLSENSRIIIKDDGHGMSLNEITNNWMVIGTSSKRRKTVSDPPYTRTFIGEKGIGRFAVEKLGAKLLMRTKKEQQTSWNVLEIDWDEYEKLSGEQLELFDQKKTVYFTDIETKFWTEEAETNLKGTQLIMSCIREVWTEYDIARAYKELSKLVSPFGNMCYPFNITVKSNEYDNYLEKRVESLVVEKFVTEQFSLDYDLVSQTQEIIKHEKGNLVKIRQEKPSFGYIKFKLYHIDQHAKGLFRKTYKGTPFEGFIDGVKIYRDGIITTPFAEYEADQNKKRDILGIDKRRWSGFWERLNSHDLIGFLEITKEQNPLIIDATNRQDFVDNPEYRVLKEFIIGQIAELEKYLKYKKEETQKQASHELKTAQDNLSTFTQQIREIERKHPSVKKDLEILEKQARKATISIKKGIKTQEELKKEIIRKENLYLSMLSLQEFASLLAHAVNTKIAKIRDKAKFFFDRFPDEQLNDIFKGYANDFYHQMVSLNKAVEFALSFSKSNLEPSEIEIKELIENVFEQYQFQFDQEQIRSIVEVHGAVTLSINRKHFEDILENLINNSIKALRMTEQKIIKCTSTVEPDKLVIYFSDNGCGISDEHKEKIFEIYFTTTAEEGGSGLGLWIITVRLKQLHGEIVLVESEFKPSGTTFKIALPFQRGKQ
ncbi:MAG: ATP-binding protein [Tissierellales bacterium]|nr:ATP-binding protein [Tissierellales bacterium]